ncbi:polysaccharide deacetylase family protein [Kordia zhangzhouensis]|uniref:polysaccharide deacetylase family protein n=1 Tax=Kordia zhangzhouensis TaxID=1620405 RepID=UPI000628FD32|nr:polysaccharide deacetylase family protein [Kordia zhangzhouensis]
MKFYTAKTPKLVKWLAPSLIWEFSVSEKSIYLTFDDGPIPEVTPWVIEQLSKVNAKATFFCIGDNVEKYPEIFKQLIREGHAIGNHTQHHVNGWRTSNTSYIQNVDKAEKTFSNLIDSKKNSKPYLFRPPYGKITPSQIKRLTKLDYKIIMWDVLSADFDTTINSEKCLENVIKNTKKGSIVVFHDSLKAFEKLQFTLPKVLQHFNKLGYEFKKITI